MKEHRFNYAPWSCHLLAHTMITIIRNIQHLRLYIYILISGVGSVHFFFCMCFFLSFPCTFWFCSAMHLCFGLSLAPIPLPVSGLFSCSACLFINQYIYLLLFLHKVIPCFSYQVFSSLLFFPLFSICSSFVVWMLCV